MTERKPLGPGDYVIAVLFAGIILVVAAQVFWRYVLNNPLSWPTELARLLFVWMTFLGAALAIREGLHIRVGLVTDKLPARAKKWVSILNPTLMILFLGFVAYVGFQWMWNPLNANARTPALGLPRNYVLYGSLPVAAVIGLYFAARQLIVAWQGRNIDTSQREDA